VYLSGNPRLYQGVLCFKNSIQFRSASVNVISFKPIKQGLPYILMKLTNVQTSLLANLLHRISEKFDIQCGKHGQKFISRTYVKCCFQSADSHDTHSNSVNFYESLNILLFQVKKNAEHVASMLFTPLSNVWFSLHRFPWNSQLFTIITCDLVHQIWPKTVKKYGR